MSGDENNSKNSSGAVAGVALRSASYSKLNQQEAEESPEPKPRRPLVSSHWQFSRTKCLFVSLVVLAALVFVGLGLGYGLQRIKEDENLNADYTTDMDDDEKTFRDYLIGAHGRIHLKDYSSGSFSKAAVVTHSPICAKIAKDILQINGTAVDAAIAALLCEGVSNPQSMGIGGGFFMLLYVKKDKRFGFIDARETAPANAYKDLFFNRTREAQVGPLSIAVPGELRGYKKAHAYLGNVEWARLFEPTIKMCRDGVLVNSQTVRSLQKMRNEIMQDPAMREVFVDKDTNEPLKEFDVMKRPKLAETLEKIAANGADDFYEGNLSKALIEDIKSMGGLLTEDDLRGYKVKMRSSVSVDISDKLEFHSATGPGSGVILAFLVQLLKLVWADLPTNLTAQEREVLVQYRFLEACKYAYTKRPEIADETFVDMQNLYGLLTDPGFADLVAKEILGNNVTFDDALHYTKNLYNLANDFGTAHVSVLDAQGNAVSVTSTLNFGFGSVLMSPSTGIILNDQMDDFSIPSEPNRYGLVPNPANYIVAGKRPGSSMSPAIIVDDKGDVQYILGGAGGSKIISAMAYVYGRHAFLGESIAQALQSPRFHHQLIPNKLEFEADVPEYLKEGMIKLGHNVTEEAKILSAVSVISRGTDGNIHAFADRRRRGGAAGI